MNEPMTVYHIIDIKKDKLWAQTLLVENEMVHGWPTPNKYDNDIPEDATLLSPDAWMWGKEEMLSFIEETFGYLRKVVKRGKPQINVGGHYVGGRGGIHTVTEIGEKIKYREFRLDEDDISPCWKGEVDFDTTKKWYAITEETYKEVLRRYDVFLSRLRKRLCGE